MTKVFWRRHKEGKIRYCYVEGEIFAEELVAALKKEGWETWVR